MKHIINVNKKNTPEHIIHLDHQKIPLIIQTLPYNQAYQIQDTPIHTTTTQTLQEQTIHQIRQKNKHILKKTILIIIHNTRTTPQLQIQTIQENPQLKTIHTKQEKLPRTLQTLIETLTPPTHKKTRIKKENNQYTLYHQNTKIKTYKNRQYAKTIRNTLNKKRELTLQEAEYKAQRQYYKHISYDKTNKTYKITLNQKTISTHKKLTHALEERNIQTKTKEKEEETLCQTTHNTTQAPLPPAPWNNKLQQAHKKHNTYTTRHKTKHHNPDTTILIQNTHITQKQIQNIQKPDRNITTHKQTHHITKTQNKKTNTYYKTHNKNRARYIRDKLEQKKYQTNNQEIRIYEQEYQKQKQEYQKTYKKAEKTIDYYKQTKNKLTYKKTSKEEYQKEELTQKY